MSNTPSATPERSTKQVDRILSYLSQGKGLTVAVAMHELGVYALSQRIGELRRLGHSIKSEWHTTASGARVKRYFMDPMASPS